MKTSILTSFVITGFLATSAALAVTPETAEELYSGMSAGAIQREQQANPAAELHSMPSRATCPWREAKTVDENIDPLYAAYPSEGYSQHEKDYLSPANMINPVC